jgi:hypothetical protein
MTSSMIISNELFHVNNQQQLAKACAFSPCTCWTFSRSILKYKFAWLHQIKCLERKLAIQIKARQLDFLSGQQASHFYK